MTGAPADDDAGSRDNAPDDGASDATVDRRTFVSRAGAGLTLSALVRRAEAGPDGTLGPVPDTEDDPDPHTLATYRALVDACIPRSPDLAADLGDEYEAGGLQVGAERFVIWFLDNYYELPPVGGTTVEPPLAPPIAVLLDAAAAELVATGGTTGDPDPSRFEGGGPFAALTRDDRIAALALLEDHDVDTGRLPGPFQEYEGDAGYVVQGLHAFVNGGFYTEWEGYGSTRLEAPDEWEFEGEVTSWDQTKYPGPSRGYAVHRGYEVQAFRENDWREDETDDGDGGDPGASGGDKSSDDGSDKSSRPGELPADPVASEFGGGF